MRWNAQSNDLKLHRGVVIRHQPLRPAGDEDPATQLWCDRFEANLIETGGLAGWFEGSAPAPRLVSAQGSGSVVVRSAERWVHADRLRYLQDARLLQLWGEPVSMIEDPNQRAPRSIQAARVEWDLAADRLEVHELSPGRVPLAD
jgi:hypothetical protein